MFQILYIINLIYKRNLFKGSSSSDIFKSSSLREKSDGTATQEADLCLSFCFQLISPR